MENKNLLYGKSIAVSATNTERFAALAIQDAITVLESFLNKVYAEHIVPEDCFGLFGLVFVNENGEVTTEIESHKKYGVLVDCFFTGEAEFVLSIIEEFKAFTGQPMELEFYHITPPVNKNEYHRFFERVKEDSLVLRTFCCKNCNNETLYAYNSSSHGIEPILALIDGLPAML